MLDAKKVGRRLIGREVAYAARLVAEELESRVLMSASSLDTTFGALHTGKVTQNITSAYDVANAVKILPDGRVLAAGGDGYDFAIARYKTNGSPDPTFGGGTGIVKTNFSPAGGTLADSANAIAVLSSGKFLVAGTGNGDFALARYNTDGTLDTTFGPSHTGKVLTDFYSKTGDSAAAIAVQADGKILLLGTDQNAAGGFDIALVRYTASGALDTTFGSLHTGKDTTDFDNQSDAGVAVAAIGGGKILVGATVTWSDTKGAAADSDFAVLRYNADGSIDPTFGKGGDDGDGVVTADFSPASSTTFANEFMGDMSVCCCGEIVVAGSTTVGKDSAGAATYDFAVAKYKANGTLDTTFNKTGKATVSFGNEQDIGRSVQLLSNDKVLVTGTTVTGAGAALATDDFAMARFNANGALDTTFATGGKSVTDFGSKTKDDAHGLSVAPNGNFVVAGSSNNDFAVARYVGDKNIGPHICGGQLVHKPKVTVGGSTSGTIANEDGIDLYSFTATAGQTIGFDVAGTTAAFDSYIRIFDANGVEIIANDNAKPAGKTGGFSGESYLKYTFATAGIYYIGISGAPNTVYDFATGGNAFDGSIGAYVFTTTNFSTTVVDSNDQISEASSIVIGSSTAGSIAFSTDVNVYKFTVTAGQRIGFNINTVAGSTFNSYIRIFNSSGTVLIYNDNGAATGETVGLSSYVEYTFVTAGTYYIGVSGASNISYNVVTGASDVSGSIGSYTLVLNKITTFIDVNDTISESSIINIGSTITDSISVGADVNVYRFVVTAGQKLGFDIDWLAGSTLDSYLRIFNSSGIQISFNNDGAAPGETLTKASYLVYTFTTAGTYYLGISGNPNSAYNITTGAGDVAGGTGAYTLTSTDLTPGGVDNDPGDKISEAKAFVLGTTVSDVLDTTTDVIMYKFTVVAGHRIGFDIDGTTDTYLRIFNGSGSNLTSDDDDAAPGETLGKASYAEYTFTAGGTYYVGVSGGTNRYYNAVTGLGDTTAPKGPYTLTLRPVGENDPDDQISEAHSTSVGATVANTIDQNVDVDMYKFTATAGQRIGFDVRLSGSSNLSSYIRLFNSSGAQLDGKGYGTAPGESSTGSSSYLEHQFASGGTYYIGISGVSNYTYDAITGLYDEGSTTSGAYTLKLGNLTTGVGAHNTIGTAEALGIGTTVSEAISFSTDVDVYRIVVGKGQTVSFDVDTTSGALDAYLAIYTSDVYYEATNYAGAAPGETIGKDPYLEHTFGTAGTYYVAISGEPNTSFNIITGGNVVSGSVGTYTLTTSDVPSQDPDDQLIEAHPLSIGGTATDSINTPTDVDMYRITVAKGQTVSFNVNRPAGSALDAYLAIYTSDGYYETTNYASAAPGEKVGTDPYVEHTFGTAGTYYVAISGESNTSFNVQTGGGDVYGSMGAYSLTLSDVSSQDSDDQLVESHPLAIGGTASDSISTPTDVDIYRITVAKGQTVAFNVNTPGGSALDAYLAIYTADGYYEVTNYAGSAPNESTGTDPYIEHTFTTAGTYYVAISGEPNTSFNVQTGGGDVYGSMGAYTLTLGDVSSQDANDQLSEAAPISTNTSFSSSISTPTDVNIYSFVVSAGQKVDFSVTAASGNLNPYLAIYTSDGYYETTTYNHSVAHTFTTAGTYYVAISDQGNTSFNVRTGGGDRYANMGGYVLTLRPA